MTQLIERLKEAYENGEQRGTEVRPEFIRLHGGRALYPYRNFKDLLRPNLQDLIHDLRLFYVEGPKEARNLTRVSDYGYHPLEAWSYFLGAYISLVRHSDRT